MSKYCQRCFEETDFFYLSNINRQRLCFKCYDHEKIRWNKNEKHKYVQEIRTWPTVAAQYLLLESGDNFLLESGDKLKIQELIMADQKLSEFGNADEILIDMDNNKIKEIDKYISNG